MTPWSPKRRALWILLLLLPIALLATWRAGKRQLPEAALPAPTTQARATSSRALTPDPRTRKLVSIEGRVTDPALAPIARAMVCGSATSSALSEAETRAPVCTETDQAGRYRLAGLFAARWSVGASAPGHLPTTYRSPGADGVPFLDLDAGEARADVDLILPGGGIELKGHVKDISGGSVRGARVTVWSMGDYRANDAGAIALSDAEGAFSVWVHAGRVSASADVEGYAQGSSRGSAPGPEIEILLTPESALVGRVIDARSHEPVASARVSVGAVSDWLNGEDAAAALSDAEGRFTIRRLTPGRYKPSATTPGRFGKAKESVLLGLGQTSSEVLIEVYPASVVSGRVVMANTNEPCSRGGVYLNDVARRDTLFARLEKDGSARFLAVLPGTYTVDVHCEKRASEPRYPPLIVAEADVEGLVWTVLEGSTIRGHVVDHDDKPILARVSARMKGGDPRTQRAWRESLTEADGSFEIKGLLPATYTLEADTEGRPSPEPTVVELLAGRTLDVKIVFDRGGDIEGIVVDEDGRPVAGVDVSATGPKWTWGNETQSLSDGSFTLHGLAPGDYRVTAEKRWSALRAPGKGDDDTPGVVAAVKVGQAARVRLVVERQSGQIQGRVLDDAGEPATDAFVDAERESESQTAMAGGAQRTLRWEWSRTPVLTDPEGKFTLGGLSPGNYTLHAFRKGGGEALAEHVLLGATVTLTIRKTGVISGTVAAAGALLERFTLRISDKEAGLSRSESFFRTGGAWSMSELPAGNYDLFAEAPEGTATAKVVLVDGHSQEGIALSLTARAAVRGQVVSLDDGSPVAGMQVKVGARKEDSSFSTDDPEGRNITDAAGRFEVQGAPSGAIRILVMPIDRENSDYGWSFIPADAAEGVTDVGRLLIARRRVKARDRAGDLGFALKEFPPGADPAELSLEVGVVRAGSPGALSGLQAGDVIVSVDGHEVTGRKRYLYNPLSRVPAGVTIALGLARGVVVSITAAKPL